MRSQISCKRRLVVRLSRKVWLRIGEVTVCVSRSRTLPSKTAARTIAYETENHRVEAAHHRRDGASVRDCRFGRGETWRRGLAWWCGMARRRLAWRGRLAGWLGGARRWWLESPCRLARQRPTSRLVQARVGQSRVARTRRLGLRLAYLAQARVRRPRRGLVGLASYLGLERLWLGMGPRFMGLGQPVCWCLDRRNCRSSGDRGAAADLRRTAADCCRTSIYPPAADRSGPASRCCSFCTCCRAAAGRPAARRDGAAADRGPAAPRNYRCGGAAINHLHAARLRVLYRPSRPGLRHHRARVVG